MSVKPEDAGLSTNSSAGAGRDAAATESPRTESAKPAKEGVARERRSPRRLRNRRPSGEASRADDVYHQILLRIVRGELAGGLAVKSTLLARELGVSRTPVVQALHRLAADGLIRLELNKRAVVRPGAENWLVEVHQLRELLEPQAARLAATHLPADVLESLEKLSVEASPHKSADWLAKAQELDFALHLALADHCENLALGSAIKKCWSFKRLSYEAIAEKPEVMESGWYEHKAILDALRRRDGETSAVAMLFHLKSAANLRPAQTIV